MHHKADCTCEKATVVYTKAVQHPRLPPLVLAVVTATENACMLEKWSSFFFIQSSSTRPSVHQWSSLSFQGKMKFGVSANYFRKQFQHLLHMILSIHTSCFAIAKHQNINFCVYSSAWLTCSAPWSFLQRCRHRRGTHSGSLPWDTMRILTPKIDESSSPSNFSALLCAPLSDWGHTHRLCTLSCTEMVCILLRNTLGGFCQVLQWDCIV